MAERYQLLNYIRQLSKEQIVHAAGKFAETASIRDTQIYEKMLDEEIALPNGVQGRVKDIISSPADIFIEAVNGGKEALKAYYEKVYTCRTHCEETKRKIEEDRKRILDQAESSVLRSRAILDKANRGELGKIVPGSKEAQIIIWAKFQAASFFTGAHVAYETYLKLENQTEKNNSDRPSDEKIIFQRRLNNS